MAPRNDGEITSSKPPETRNNSQPTDWAGASRQKAPTGPGHVAFTLLRLLDLPLQYWFLRSGLGNAFVQRIGGTAVSSPSTTTALGLSPYHSLVFGLAVGSAAKQVYWSLVVSDTEFPVPFAGSIAVYNTVLNSLNTLLSIWAVSSQQPSGHNPGLSLANAPLETGAAFYCVGLFVEWYCEVQRKAFKAKPENKGRAYSGGLFGLARNINYGGYTLWRTGYSLICGGWASGVLVAAWVAGDFIARAIPSMDTYCEKRVRFISLAGGRRKVAEGIVKRLLTNS